MYVFRVMMVEALSEDLSTEDLMKYTEVCDFAFNFNFVVHLKSPASAEAIEEQILDWLQNLPAGKTANWVVRTCLPIFYAKIQQNPMGHGLIGHGPRWDTVLKWVQNFLRYTVLHGFVDF